MKTTNKTALIITGALFALILGFNLYLFFPMIHALLFAGILAGTFYPLHTEILERFKGKREIASAVTTLLITLSILLPMIYTILQVSKEGMNLYRDINQSLSQEAVKNFFFGDGFFANLLQDGIDFFEIQTTKQELYQEILSKAQGMTSFLVNSVNGFVSNTFNFVFQFFMMVLAIYGFFHEGEKFKRYIASISPLSEEDHERILAKFNQMNYVTLVGNGIGGLVQGVFAGLIFWACGIPSVFLWTTIMVILAFVPLLGVSIITIPAGIALFVQGEVIQSLFLIISTGIVAFLVENWFKPKFIGAKVKINSLILLFYIVAGMMTFGMAGIFYGPILCTVLITMGEIFFGKLVQEQEKEIL